MDPLAKGPRCLAVGLPAALVAGEGFAPDEAASIDYRSLATAAALPAGVELVIGPLFCTDFDALELIETLGALGYRADVRIVAPKLPSRQMVLRELRAHAARQGMSLKLVEGP